MVSWLSSKALSEPARAPAVRDELAEPELFTPPPAGSFRCSEAVRRATLRVVLSCPGNGIYLLHRWRRPIASGLSAGVQSSPKAEEPRNHEPHERHEQDSRLEQNDEWSVQRARYMSLESVAALGDTPMISLPLMAV
jgi:hypothetical protein